jgi:hypothetical protein
MSKKIKMSASTGSFGDINDDGDFGDGDDLYESGGAFGGGSVDDEAPGGSGMTRGKHFWRCLLARLARARDGSRAFFADFGGALQKLSCTCAACVVEL